MPKGNINEEHENQSSAGSLSLEGKLGAKIREMDKNKIMKGKVSSTEAGWGVREKSGMFMKGFGHFWRDGLLKYCSPKVQSKMAFQFTVIQLKFQSNYEFFIFICMALVITRRI